MFGEVFIVCIKLYLYIYIFEFLVYEYILFHHEFKYVSCKERSNKVINKVFLSMIL